MVESVLQSLCPLSPLSSSERTIAPLPGSGQAHDDGRASGCDQRCRWRSQHRHRRQHRIAVTGAEEVVSAAAKKRIC